ncbi:iron-sulfur cluster assembly accessory protein [Bacteriovorax sp. DB6_IX]|uniref:HesB/IscA family protein n=1 Tax=Bacteriovorax sp. DB6_IX TaxID=1353530 RepID=UPI00038A395D|nr:iron-sulfur cluster assembly accessory protein [Bacteriovorax sp. DB6_IX]EQC51502.1 iron-sulfur cluster assembly accessory protein [Bacteriovorax sp. DB6_IX]
MTTSANSSRINRKDIVLPTVTFTEVALEQLTLMLENDFTLSGKYLRILISGKGCDGFTYSVGFTDIEDEDFSVRISNDEALEVIIDPFAAFYLGDTRVDYVQDFQNDREGFVVYNKDQKKYHGKFWRENKELVPPMVHQ